jgi:ribosomal protein S18 acetylase RimI-like enzyme
MPLEIRAKPAQTDVRDRILPIIFDMAREAGLPFAPEEIALEAWDGEQWLGGLTARVTQGWLFLHLLGVAPEAQGRRIGTRLMEAVEALGREKGLIGIWLDTYSFQAPGFYEKLRYEEVGRIPDYPPGQARIFLAKRLDGRPVQEPPA